MQEEQTEDVRMMAVIPTNEWLRDHYDKPLELCEKLRTYFRDAPASSILDHFRSHGMYGEPEDDGKELLDRLEKKRFWEIIREEEKALRTIWQGPDAPVFIFPSDSGNRRMSLESNGKSGLAFRDKLFLFVSPRCTVTDLKALLTHEYHHVCRLSAVEKKEKDYTLLDAVILEGLAENAVRERHGEEATASWTAYYTESQLEKIWSKLVLPHQNLPKGHPRHQRILYGRGLHPKMAGYCAGYYKVRSFMKESRQSTIDLLGVSAEEIAGICDSNA